MFLKILKVQIELYKDDLLNLANLNNSIIEFCELCSLLNKKSIVLNNNDEQLKLLNVAKKLNRINYKLEKMNKMVRIL